MNAPILESVSGDAFAAAKQRLDRLGTEPPQVLLIEGGTEQQRFETALYWACRANCPQAAKTGSPCLSCPVCQQTTSLENLDLKAFDGRISNKQDETPGLIRALNIENIRELKSLLRDPPHANFHVTILTGIEGSRVAAANALLKALEEPSPGNLFVLLCVQREQLLPTLVSRSFCFTLPWPDPEGINPETAAMQAELARFFSDGRLFFAKTGSKTFEMQQAVSVFSAVHKSLLKVFSGHTDKGPLEAIFSHLSLEGLFQVSRWLSDASQALEDNAAPARVTEAFLAQTFVLLHNAG